MNAVHRLVTDHIGLWTEADTERKSGRGRSSGSAGSVYGIKKLRELILELAVRGKLVPQDANDEPASALLERVQAEKARLILAGKIKKGKPIAPIKDEKNLGRLPDGWVCARLADVANILNGRAYKKEELLDKGTPVLRVGNLFTSNHWYYSDLVLDDDKYCNSGDLLFAWSASFGPFIWDGEKSIYHYHIWKLDLYGSDLLFKRFLYTFLLEQTQKIKSAGHGVMMIHMTKEEMEKLVVYLPPILEQKRIVAKVDELMALCDQLESGHAEAIDAHERLVSYLLAALTASQDSTDFSASWQRIAAHFDMLFTTEASIDALKQSLLQLAVMGKLVPQNATDEPASALMRRISEEKATLVLDGKIKKEKPMPAIADDEKPFALAQGWVWARFNDYATDIATGPFGSMIHQTDYVDSGVPLINPSHMIDDRISPDLAVSVSRAMAETLESYVLCDGDIVMARRGEVGRIALVTSHENGWLCGTGSFVLRFCDEISRDYLRVFFRCNSTRAYLAGEAVGTTMVNLNHGILKKMPMGVPPVTEQYRIVAKVDELMELCDRIKTGIIDASATQRKLADVLVARAVA